MMFDLKELKLMFMDPTDLIINNINKFLSSKKAIKFIAFLLRRNLFILFITKSVGSKNISFSSFKSNIIH